MGVERLSCTEYLPFVWHTPDSRTHREKRNSSCIQQVRGRAPKGASSSHLTIPSWGRQGTSAASPAHRGESQGQALLKWNKRQSSTTDVFHFSRSSWVNNTMCAHTLSRFSRVRLFATPWTVAHQAPLSTGFSRQEYWSGLPCTSPGDLPDPGIKPMSHVSCIGRRVLYH